LPHKRLTLSFLSQDVIESVGELIDELETAEGHCAVQAVEHVTPGCVVLTAGGSCSVEAFLREANKKRTFQCVVAEGEPGGAGHRLAKLLADKGVATTVIADAATFAVMPRCHLVVLGAKGVFHDGTALCAAGHRAVAVAAKAHRVPVLVLAGTHELSPLGPGDPEYDMDDLKSPCEIFDFAGRDAGGFSANSNAVSSADDSPNPAEPRLRPRVTRPDFPVRHGRGRAGSGVHRVASSRVLLAGRQEVRLRLRCRRGCRMPTPKKVPFAVAAPK
jgi:translation initiation factor 2B subunit (eIF-2B alpha/beta/delta family)